MSNTDDNMCAVTFAGIVVSVNGTKRESLIAVTELSTKHPDAAITVAVL